MAGVTNIRPFADSAAADVQSDDAYFANAPTGFIPGPAYPNQANKALRQSSIVAAAIARFVTDDAYGKGSSFNDTESVDILAGRINDAIYKSAEIPRLRSASDVAIGLANTISGLMGAPSLGGQQQLVNFVNSQPLDVATRLAQAIYNLPTIRLNNIVADLFKRLLINTYINPGEADKFTDDKLLSYTPEQLDALVNTSLYKTILTRRGILERPPISGWLYLDQAKVTPYTDVGGYTRPPEYRILANGMVEIRCGFLKGFRTKTSRHIFLLGSLPNRYSPCSGERKIIVGSAFDSKYVAGTTAHYADMSVVVNATSQDAIEANPDKFDTDVYVTYTDQTVTKEEPWSMVYGNSGYNPFGKPAGNADTNVYIGTMVSLTYMPKFPLPYAYYKGPVVQP